MATIAQRTGKDGQQFSRVKVRRQGAPPLSATCTKLSEVRKWVQVTESAIIEGRHCRGVEAQNQWRATCQFDSKSLLGCMIARPIHCHQGMGLVR